MFQKENKPFDLLNDCLVEPCLNYCSITFHNHCYTFSPSVWSRCEGNSECSLKASNGDSDPCSGTYKYLNISYACGPPGKKLERRFYNEMYFILLFHIDSECCLCGLSAQGLLWIVRMTVLRDCEIPFTLSRENAT